ncbi:MAG: hypothetical protein A2Y92_05815 [Chloroflexi bacterium RBG_13_57_8]|nr:MAG: hypothetical protein A2Y92_05815 [Chloroflexi bacterium RBG_13_57_8]
MPAPKCAKYIVTDTREYTPEEVPKIQEMIKKSPVASTVKLFRLLWMDDRKVKGASLYMECIWLWEGKTTSGMTEEPHVHDFDEVIGFIGSDENNPKELGARMEIILGDETHFLTKSCLVHIPAGLKHCPLTFREVNRPVFFFTLAPISRYGRRTEGKKSVRPPGKKWTAFVPPPPNQAGKRYAGQSSPSRRRTGRPIPRNNGPRRRPALPLRRRR